MLFELYKVVALMFNPLPRDGHKLFREPRVRDWLVVAVLRIGVRHFPTGHIEPLGVSIRTGGNGSTVGALPRDSSRCSVGTTR